MEYGKLQSLLTRDRLLIIVIGYFGQRRVSKRWTVKVRNIVICLSVEVTRTSTRYRLSHDF